MTDPVPAAPVQSPDPADAPVAALPDRGDAPVSEVAERFLRAVVAQVPLELIEELHLFSPLRQGTVETGIAVVATRVPLVVAEAAEAPELPFVGEAPPLDNGTAEAETAEGGTADAEMTQAVTTVEEGAIAEMVGDIGAADEVVSVLPEPPEGAPPRPVRHTVYTARYRYVIKGPERGKWESNVKAEADAPLVTVETVVRGVQRRAGEESEIVRYTGAQIARALRVPQPA